MDATATTTETEGGVMRRRLFDGEIGVRINNPEHMELLAEMLEIQSDGGDSAGDFVAYTLDRFDKELRARYHQKRAEELRQEGKGDE